MWAEFKPAGTTNFMPEKPPLYILKIGGSVATQKTKNAFETNAKLLVQIAEQIKKAMDQKFFSLIVVNGAGPFGHMNVINYNINNGIESGKNFEGFCKTVADCSRINLVVSYALQKAGIKSYPLPSSSVVIQENKKIKQFSTVLIESLLQLRVVPVMNGTMCPDTKIRGSVVSGDAIIAYLAKQFNASAVFMGADVDGIMTADPKQDPDAKLIPEINRKNFSEVMKSVGGASTADVTGGMKGKIEKLKDAFPGRRVVVFNASSPENVFRALTGEKIGTEILF
jgi:isopentenyl phosphate kinase